MDKYDPDYGELVSDPFVPDLSPQASMERTQRRWKFQIRTQCADGVLIADKEVMEEWDFRKVMMRASQLFSRTSFVVGGRNREVLWAVDIWDEKEHDWRMMCGGKATLPKGGTPK